jgi:hypothetical protein
MPKWEYYRLYGALGRTVAEERGDFDTPEAKAATARRDRKAREFWGMKPKPIYQPLPGVPTSGPRPKLVRQRRAPLAIQRRRVHRERRARAVRVARRRSTSASRDGPDDSDPSPAPAVAALIAAAGIHHTFAEQRLLLAPLFSPAETLRVFSLLPSEAAEEAWAS